jgi:hypothetical protein
LGILVSLIFEVVTCFWQLVIRLLLASGGWQLIFGHLLRKNASSKEPAAKPLNL